MEKKKDIIQSFCVYVLWHKVINYNFYHRQQCIFQTFTFRKTKHTPFALSDMLKKKNVGKKHMSTKLLLWATANATDFDTF